MRAGLEKGACVHRPEVARCAVSFQLQPRLRSRAFISQPLLFAATLGIVAMVLTVRPLIRYNLTHFYSDAHYALQCPVGVPQRILYHVRYLTN